MWPLFTVSLSGHYSEVSSDTGLAVYIRNIVCKKIEKDIFFNLNDKNLNILQNRNA